MRLLVLFFVLHYYCLLSVLVEAYNNSGGIQPHSTQHQPCQHNVLGTPQVVLLSVGRKQFYQNATTAL